MKEWHKRITRSKCYINKEKLDLSYATSRALEQ